MLGFFRLFSLLEFFFFPLFVCVGIYPVCYESVRHFTTRIMPDPPHSSDLALCDFWLFDLIRQNLSDHDDSESLDEAVNKFMKSLKKEEYKKIFDK
jgi:hypothetical protein